MTENAKRITADISLLLVSVIWGATFPFFNQLVLAGMGGLLINAIKFTFGAAFVFILFFRDAIQINRGNWARVFSWDV